MIGLVEGRVVDMDAFVGAHRQAVLDRVAVGVRTEGEDGDGGIGDLVLDTKSSFDAYRVELGRDGLDAGDWEDLLGGLVQFELRGGRLWVRHLLDAADDVGHKR
jgi:hypothetical protein